MPPLRLILFERGVARLCRRSPWVDLLRACGGGLLRGCGDFGTLVIRGFGAAFYKMHGVENGLNYRVVPDGGVEHDVVEGAGGPVGIEVVLHVGDALAIDGIDQFVSFRPAVAFGHGAADFFGARSVEEDVECVGVLAQIDKERRGRPRLRFLRAQSSP